jgi:hypothetical protein
MTPCLEYLHPINAIVVDHFLAFFLKTLPCYITMIIMAWDLAPSQKSHNTKIMQSILEILGIGALQVLGS